MLGVGLVGARWICLLTSDAPPGEGAARRLTGLLAG
jgi:hypothetical protein